MIRRIKKVIPLYERVGMFTEAPGDGSTSTSTATPSSSNDSDDTDYTAGAEDTSSSDTDSSDSNESDTKVDEPDETDYTDGAEDNDEDTDDDSSDSSGDDSGDDTDYTDGADDSGDSPGDDGTSDSSDDSGGDSGSDDSVTKDDMRKYSLFGTCMDLYRTIQYFTERLETFTADNKYFNAASKKAKKIFIEAGDMLKDYLILKFQSDTYSQNSYFYENVKALCMLALHLMENNIPQTQIKNANNKQ